jgi:hypothetical protein
MKNENACRLLQLTDHGEEGIPAPLFEKPWLRKRMYKQ